MDMFDSYVTNINKLPEGIPCTHWSPKSCHEGGRLSWMDLCRRICFFGALTSKVSIKIMRHRFHHGNHTIIIVVILIIILITIILFISLLCLKGIKC